MKWKVVVLLVLFLGSFVLAEQPKNDVGVDVRILIPRKNELYNHTAGVNVMARHWFNDEFGFGLSAGYESWRYDDASVYSPTLPPIRVRIEGTANVYPVGLHALWRFRSGKPFIPMKLFPNQSVREMTYKEAGWTVSAGLVYLYIDDSAQLAAEGGGIKREWSLSTDETWAARIEVTYEDKLPFLKQNFIIGAGYQRDLSRGNVEIEGLGISETNDMTAFFLRFGVPIVF